MCYAEGMADTSEPIALSVVAAAHNEQDNVARLVEQIVAALEPTQLAYEIIIVDDGSTDRTLAMLKELLTRCDRLRVLRMVGTPADRGLGQSAAFHAGFRAACGELIVLLDADCQNDPADIPAMLQILQSSGADMVQGDRSFDRRDSQLRQLSSLVGRLFRRWLLGDTIRDTGCSLRVIRREVALALPLEFRGMHRFIPLTARQLGYNVVEMPVHHRPRTAGTTKYGIRNRAIPGLIDCFAVRWMRNRRRPVRCEEIESPASPTISTSTADREKATT